MEQVLVELEIAQFLLCVLQECELDSIDAIRALGSSEKAIEALENAGASSTEASKLAIRAFGAADESCDNTIDIWEMASEVLRIPYNGISSKKFRETYSATGRPVVLTGGPVPGQWSSDNLCDKYGERRIILERGDAQRERQTSLKEFCTALKDTSSNMTMNKLYLRGLHMREWFPEEPLLDFPQVFGENELSKKNYPTSWFPWAELFINGPQCQGFPFLHRDMCNTHAYTMQIEGRKRFIMFDDSVDRSNLYPEGITETRSRIPAAKLVEGCVDGSKFPQLRESNPMATTLSAGDILFIPANTWHATVSLDAPTVSIGGNFVNIDNVDAFKASWQDFQAATSIAQHSNAG